MNFIILLYTLKHTTCKNIIFIFLVIFYFLPKLINEMKIKQNEKKTFL